MSESQLGIVAIGRNEGERLASCIRSLPLDRAAAVYVDSGSSDTSVERARQLGAQVVELDSSRPFTAARGRNAGFTALSERLPDLQWVQFIDGDCDLQPGWLDRAEAYLREHPDVAVVCGRRRERHPDASPYNRLADLEWDTPIGDAEACGGDALMRATVVREVGGYNEKLIAGEDPEFCFRIRAAGHRIVRLDCEMTLHDAALERFSQWWRRQSRSGHAFAELASLHADKHRVGRLFSILLWAGVLPGIGLLGLPFTNGASLGLLAALPIQGLRIMRASPQPAAIARLHATALMLGKFAELQGVLTFAVRRLRGGKSGELIEYKGPAQAGPRP